MYRFVGDKQGLEPIPGLPLEASDHDFEEVLDALPADEREAIKKSGLYNHEKDAPVSRETPVKEE